MSAAHRALPRSTRRGATLLITPAVAGAVTAAGFPGIAAAAPAPAMPAAAQLAPATAPASAPTATATTATAASTARTAAAAVYLRRGQRGPMVLAVQQRLGVRPQTGYFGPITEAAVKTFQRRNGLPATGVVDDRTGNLLGIKADPPPPSGYSYSLGSVRPHVRAAAYEIGPKFGIRRIGGVRASSGDHGKGLALDLMSSFSQGEGAAAYSRANAARLRVSYVIWNRRIWHVRRAGEGWRNYNGPNPHTDHVHVSFLP